MREQGEGTATTRASSGLSVHPFSSPTGCHPSARGRAARVSPDARGAPISDSADAIRARLRCAAPETSSTDTRSLPICKTRTATAVRVARVLP